METAKFTHWQDGTMWLGYLEEYPDYMTQGETFDELKDTMEGISKASQVVIPASEACRESFGKQRKIPDKPEGQNERICRFTFDLISNLKDLHKDLTSGVIPCVRKVAELEVAGKEKSGLAQRFLDLRHKLFYN